VTRCESAVKKKNEPSQHRRKEKRSENKTQSKLHQEEHICAEKKSQQAVLQRGGKEQQTGGEPLTGMPDRRVRVRPTMEQFGKKGVEQAEPQHTFAKGAWGKREE